MWKDYLEQFDPNYYELNLNNEKTNNLHSHNSNVMSHESVQLPGFSGMETHALTHQHAGPYSHSPDLSHFQIPGMNHNINLMGK